MILKKKNCKYYFREFASYEGQCRFQGCDHVHEPGCSGKRGDWKRKIHPVDIKLSGDVYRIERKEEVLIYEKQNCTIDFVGRLLKDLASS